MKDQDQGARMIIAGLYLRYREARRHANKTMKSQGVLSPAFIRADAQAIEANNALQSALNWMNGNCVRFQSAHELMKVAGIRGSILG